MDAAEALPSSLGRTEQVEVDLDAVDALHAADEVWPQAS